MFISLVRLDLTKYGVKIELPAIPLGIPKNFRLISVLPIGIPRNIPEKDRKELSQLVYRDKFKE